MENIIGEYWHLKNKYEELQEELKREREFSQEQLETIYKYQTFFTANKIRVPFMSKKDQRRIVQEYIRGTIGVDMRRV